MRAPERRTMFNEYGTERRNVPPMRLRIAIGIAMVAGITAIGIAGAQPAEAPTRLYEQCVRR